jgi:hypothetical protein
MSIESMIKSMQNDIKELKEATKENTKEIKEIKETGRQILIQIAQSQITIEALNLSNNSSHELQIAPKRQTAKIIKSDSTTVVKKTEDEINKVNAPKFFKEQILYENYKGLRAKYQHYIDIVRPECTGKKTDELSIWREIGRRIWPLLSESEKLEIKDLCNKWKKEVKITAQLEIDNEKCKEKNCKEEDEEEKINKSIKKHKKIIENEDESDEDVESIDDEDD